MSGDGRAAPNAPSPETTSGAAPDTSSHDDPSPRTIAAEIAFFAALFLVVGAAFVLARVLQRGPEVLDLDPHASHREDDHR